MLVQLQRISNTHVQGNQTIGAPVVALEGVNTHVSNTRLSQEEEVIIVIHPTTTTTIGARVVALEGDNSHVSNTLNHPTTMVIVRVVLVLEEAVTNIRTTARRILRRRRKTTMRGSYASYAIRL